MIIIQNAVAVIGAAAIGDYIFNVDQLPEKGEIVNITNSDFKLTPGGCAPNIACGMAALRQAKATLYYPVGYDFEELGLEKYWIDKGINCSLTYNDNYPSGKAWMYMQKDGTTMCFAYHGAADKCIPKVTSLKEDWIIIAPVFNAFTKTYLDNVINSEKKIIVTGIASEGIVEYFDVIDILIVNKCESEMLCTISKIETIDELTKKYPDLVVFVTYGGDGSCVYYQNKKKKIPIIEANKIVDFTGAGDAYTSGVVSAIIAGYNYETAALFGATNSSYIIEQWGGQQNMPTWEDLINRLKEQYPDIKLLQKNKTNKEEL